MTFAPVKVLTKMDLAGGLARLRSRHDRARSLRAAVESRRVRHSRPEDHAPDGVGWLIRYHSIRIERCAPLVDARDREYTERYLRRFQQHDQGSKSLFAIPRRTLDRYRELLEQSFPRPILF